LICIVTLSMPGVKVDLVFAQPRGISTLTWCRSRDEAWKEVIDPNRQRVLIRLVLDEDPTVGGVTNAECEHTVQQDVGDVPVRVFEGGHASDDTGGIHECIDFEFVTNHTAADVTERGI